MKEPRKFKIRANRDVVQRLHAGWKPDLIAADDMYQLALVLDSKGYDVTRVGNHNLEFTPGLFLRFDYIDVNENGGREMIPGTGSYRTTRVELDITDPKEQIRVDKGGAI